VGVCDITGNYVLPVSKHEYIFPSFACFILKFPIMRRSSILRCWRNYDWGMGIFFCYINN